MGTPSAYFPVAGKPLVGLMDSRDKVSIILTSISLIDSNILAASGPGCGTYKHQQEERQPINMASGIKQWFLLGQIIEARLVER